MILQQDIDTFQSWADTWQMNFNTNKCHIMSISRQQCKPHTVYKLASTPLTYVDAYPYLSVTISSDLRWHNHISTATSKATRILNFVRRNIPLFTRGKVPRLLVVGQTASWICISCLGSSPGKRHPSTWNGSAASSAFRTQRLPPPSPAYWLNCIGHFCLKEGCIRD